MDLSGGDRAFKYLAFMFVLLNINRLLVFRYDFTAAQDTKETPNISYMLSMTHATHFNLYNKILPKKLY